MKPTRIRRVASLLVAGMLVLGGCQKDAARASEVTSFTDSSGVEISLTDLSDLSRTPRCQVRETPERAVGPESERSEAELFRVAGTLQLRDGRLAILNRGSKEILIVDPEGEIKRIGTEGEGPGEFREPIALHLFRGDSIAVWDWALHRLTILSPDGSYARSFNPTPAMANPTGHFGVIDAGRSIVIAFQEVRIPEGSAFTPQAVLLLRYSADGLVEDTVGTFPYGRTGIIDAERRLLGSPLFEPRTSFATDGDRFYVATGPTAEVQVLDATLALIRLIRWQPQDRRVTQSDAETFRAERLEGVSDALLPIMRLRYEAVPVSEEFPSVAALLADDDDGIWIQEYQRPGSDEQTWLGYDSQGGFRCIVTLPRQLQVMQFREGSLAAVDVDELGTESVVVLTVDGPGLPVSRDE
jgi:hypothetical protein